MKLTWCENEVPAGIEVHQVYAVAFNRDGKVILKAETKKSGKRVYSLAGGTPEDYDVDRIATLRREYIEEINTTLLDPIIYLGYQLVDEENGIPPYAQIRMTAMIDEIGEKKPDPDNGETYDRILANPDVAINCLSWGDIGEKIIKKATEIAKDKFNLTPSTDDSIEEI